MSDLFTQESRGSNIDYIDGLMSEIQSQTIEDEDYLHSKLFETQEKKIFTYDYSNIHGQLKKIYFFPYDIKTTIKPECFALRFDKTDNLLAGGYSTGHIVVYDVHSGNTIKYMQLSDYPISSMRWKTAGNKPILVVVHSDGKVSQWYPNAGKILYSFEEKDNFIMCLDYDHKGNIFATGGSDNTVRLYDDETKTLITTMRSSLENISHSNRIFSVCFGKNSHYESLMTSGGWDNTIKFYDVRKKEIVNSIYGPHIVGDSLDLKDHYLLTGSSDIKDQIKIWDLRTYKLLETVQFEPHLKEKSNKLETEVDSKLDESKDPVLTHEEKKDLFVTNINCAQFAKSYDNLRGKNLSTFACGGLKRNQIRVFSDNPGPQTNGLYNTRVPLIKLENIPDCVYSLDYMNSSNNLAYASGLGCIFSIGLENKSTLEEE